MCGLFGYISQTSIQKNQRLVNKCGKALDSLLHRGPDGFSLLVEDNFILGHARLEIVGPNHGSQPIQSPCGNFSMVFNGEIYNYRDLKRSLESKGHFFKGDSDSEVLLHMYMEYGEKCVDELHGMFAFAIYDCVKRQCFIARDRFGMKPFYYGFTRGNLIFSSEPRSLYVSNLLDFGVKSQNFNEFLVFGYVSGHETLHDNILELPPSFAGLFKDGKFRTWEYYNFKNQNQTLSFEKSVEHLDFLIRKNFRSWLSIDENVSALLSGGVDSSLVVSMAEKEVEQLNAITVYFPEFPAYDERSKAESTTNKLKINHLTVSLKENYIQHEIENLFSNYDEPLPSNCFALMKICQTVYCNTNSKVLIGGDGADELFGGYGRHKVVASKYANNRNEDTIYYALNTLTLERMKLFAEDSSISNSFRRDVQANLVNSDPINRVLELDLKLYLSPYLHQLDRIGMRFGLEMRSPFLEHEIVDAINSLPGTYKIKNDIGKYMLKKMAERYLSPEILWDKNKIPFSAPMIASSFQDGCLNNLYHQYINANAKIAQKYDYMGMLKLLDEHDLDKNTDHSNTLWRILTLEMWAQSS